MAKMTTRLIFTFAIIMSAVPAWADKPLPGYQCLSMNATPSQASNPNFMLTVRQGPSDQAPVMGTAGDLLIASNPVIQQNGYIQIIRPDGKPGWILASSAKPWHSANPASNARCYPEILDNGRVGFTTR